MNLFGLEGSGFIIAVGLTLLMAGIIIYYVNARLKGVQAALDKQGSVLSQLITDVRGHIGGSSGMGSQIAKDTGMKYSAAYVEEDTRIAVSDDSATESDTDSDTESDTDEENEVKIDDENNDLSIKVNDISGLRIVEVDDGAHEQISLEDDNNDSLSDSDTESQSSHDNIIETIDSNMVGTITISKLGEEHTPNIVELMEQASKVDEGDIKAMRVNQLRDLAVTQKQVPESEAKSMKKPELIQLLLEQ